MVLLVFWLLIGLYVVGCLVIIAVADWGRRPAPRPKPIMAESEADIVAAKARLHRTRQMIAFTFLGLAMIIWPSIGMPTFIVLFLLISVLTEV